MSKKESGSKLGAALVAVGASACCWLPLLLVSLGVGTTGVAAAFESARPFLIAATLGLLGAAFYLTYRNTTVCAADGSCAGAGSTGRSKITLWIVTAIAAVSFAYPYWEQKNLDEKNASADESTLGTPDVAIRIDGMTCAACGVAIHDSVSALPGVTAVVVDEEPGGVRVWGDVERSKVEDAVRDAGYTPAEELAAGPKLEIAYIEVKGMVQQLGIT